MTNIHEYSDALFLEKSSGMLVGPEHKRSGAHVFVWMGDVSQSNALQAVISHVPPAVQQRARAAATIFG